MKPVKVRKCYTCDVCGYEGPWSPFWSWYGSLRDMDTHPERLVVVCSEKCKEKWEERDE